MCIKFLYDKCALSETDMPAFEQAHLSYEKLSYDFKYASSSRAKKFSKGNRHLKIACGN